jgi:predicted ArsR family transcriptional regulator
MDAEVTPLSPSQRRVLEALKRHGEATADELAESLDISPSAVRQHLGALRSAALVSSTPARGQAGRPAERYRATVASDQLFGSGPELAVQILELVDEEDPRLVDRLFARQRERLVARSGSQLDGMSVGQRVAALTERLDADGYLADFDPVDNGCYRLHLHNCPIWSVAGQYPQACAAELGVVQDLIPNATVTRATHKTAGAHTCTYEITEDR